MNKLTSDCKYYLICLCSKPGLLIKSIPAILGKAVSIIINRAKVKINAKHRGLKQAIPWLEIGACLSVNACSKINSQLSLPSYPETSTALLVSTRTSSLVQQTDPEAYFKENRWGFLVEILFEGVNNLNSNLPRVTDWIRTHTDKQDDAWETYSSCERISNLLVYLSVVDSSSLTKDSKKEIVAFVADSSDWICRHIEYYGPEATNNHILNNARALVLSGVAFANITLLHAGMKIFHECLPVMIEKHGLLRERSSHYQLIICGWVLDAWRFTAHHYGSNHVESLFLLEYVRRMISASAMLSRPDGRLLGLVGDISPDLSPEDSHLRLARLYPEYWPVTDAREFCSSSKDDWFRIERGNQTVLGNFPKGFYPPTFPTHGHCDYTSFIWTHNGAVILGDTGRYRYTSDAVSSLQRGPLGHNLLLVDGFPPLCESLSQSGQWWPLPYAIANLHSSMSSGEIHLTHDGFSRATNVQRHTRRIALTDAGLEVTDSLEGNGDAMIQLRWNFGQNFDVFDYKLQIVRGAGGIVYFVTKGFEVTPIVDFCSGGHCEGWTSTAYGEVVPSIAIDVSGKVKLPVVISTCFKVIPCAG